MWGLRLGEGCRVSHLLSTPRCARPRYLRCMYDVHGVCTPSCCVSRLIHGWLGSRGQPRLATNFWTRSWFAAADGWTRLPRKVTRWPPGNVRSRTLADAYGRWFPVRGFCSFRVWPCQTLPQCAHIENFSVLPSTDLSQMYSCLSSTCYQGMFCDHQKSGRGSDYGDVAKS